MAEVLRVVGELAQAIETWNSGRLTERQIHARYAVHYGGPVYVPQSSPRDRAGIEVSLTYRIESIDQDDMLESIDEDDMLASVQQADTSKVRFVRGEHHAEMRQALDGDDYLLISAEAEDHADQSLPLLYGGRFLLKGFEHPPERWVDVFFLPSATQDLTAP